MLGLTVSFEDSRLTLIRVIVLCVHFGTWVVEHCGTMVNLCDRALVPGVRNKINLITSFWLQVFVIKSDTYLIDYIGIIFIHKTR